MAATKLDEFGRPIDNPFFGGGGLGGALASLPGTPILGGGASAGSSLPPPGTATGGTGLGPDGMPNGTNSPNPGRYAPPGGALGGFEQPGGYTGSGEETPEGAYGDWTGTRPTAGGGGTNVSNTPPGGGSPIQTNPGLPPPASTAGTGGFFGGQSPFQTGVTGTLNNETVPFNSNQYVTPEAAQRLGSLLGANVVEQNTQGMASPGSGAPSQPMLGLDFGTGGDVQDASMGAFQLARGDRPEDVAARYKAGLTNTGWGGPAPQLAEAWDAPYWNRANPVSTNTPNAEQAGFFGPQSGQGDQTAFFNWLRGQIGGG